MIVFFKFNLKNSDTIIYYLLCILYYLKGPYDLTWLDRPVGDCLPAANRAADDRPYTPGPCSRFPDPRAMLPVARCLLPCAGGQ